MDNDRPSKQPHISPWSNGTIAPLQAAGAIVPVVASAGGPILGTECHGTAFFLTDDGFFLTAGHVVEECSLVAPAIVVLIFGGPGYAMMPVQFVTRHPTADVALGKTLVDDGCLPSPMTLSTRRLQQSEAVAVLGYPRSVAIHSPNSEGKVMSRLRCTPDYFEGQVLDFSPTGVGLSKGAAYVTDIVAPTPAIKDLGGASGGPLVASASLHVHGILCSSSEEYAVCTDIAHALDWEVFENQNGDIFTIRAMGQRFSGRIRVE